MQRLSIRGMMILVAVCALAVVAIRSGSEFWAGVIATLAAQATLLAVVGLRSGSVHVRGFCIGFLGVGLLQLLISFGPWSHGIRDQYWFNDAIDSLLAQAIDRWDYSSFRSQLQYDASAVSRQWYARWIAHLLLALFMGVLGGIVTRFVSLFARDRRAARDQQAPEA